MSRDEPTSARSRADIEADLAENRTRIEHTLELLEDRFTPGALIDRGWRYARSKNEDGTTHQVRDVVVRNPLPVALMGVGLAWLLLSGREGSVPSASAQAGSTVAERQTQTATATTAKPSPTADISPEHAAPRGADTAAGDRRVSTPATADNKPTATAHRATTSDRNTARGGPGNVQAGPDTPPRNESSPKSTAAGTTATTSQPRTSPTSTSPKR